ncbi:AI-2E family transporter [Halegenticoccus tardaugens]|uniref:AI-2E family transporter n=1 Tax=Halegenticoccus tardaugens TaxID=2071624 RepID=UPI00100A3FEC|nr:AI-2E family transporter [Halegenticoccus tardaugens]
MTDDPFGQNRNRLGWWILTIALLAVLLYVGFAFLGTFVLGLFVYYATRPVYERIDERIRPRSLRVFLALFLVALPVLVLIAYTVAVGVREFATIAGTDIESYQRFVQPYVDLSAASDPQRLLSSIRSGSGQFGDIGNTDTAQRVLEAAGSYLGALVSGLLQLFIAFTFAFYLLRDDHRLAAWVRAAVNDENDVLYAYGKAVDRDLKTIYFGNILNAFVVAVVAALSYSLLDLVAPPGLSIPVSALLGLLTGAASLIPVVGMKLVYVPVAAYLFALALLNDPGSIWYPVTFLAVALVVIDGVTEILLRPYISGRNLHVGMVLFAYIIGPILFGWYGLFLGPLLLVLIVHLARIVVPDLLGGTPLTPTALGADPIPDLNGDADVEGGDGIDDAADDRSDAADAVNADGAGAPDGPTAEPDRESASDRDERVAEGGSQASVDGEEVDDASDPASEGTSDETTR